MPLFVLAAALLFQQAPHVQDVTETAEGYTCRAQQLPELRIAHDWRDGNRGAALRFQAREGGGDALGLSIAFAPAPDRAYGTLTTVLGFQLDNLRFPLRAPATGAHLRIDSLPDTTVLAVQDPATDYVTVAVIERQRADLADRLMRASIVELDLTDASGVPLRRYSWDVRKLRRAPELLQLINWSCR